MIDIGTGLALLGTAKLIEKLLGPSAEYLGEGIKSWTARRVTNVRHIFERAGRKLGKQIEEPGCVPPQVLRLIINEGSYASDDIQQEYFAGLLASARSKNGQDDRAITYSAVISGMSHYQLKSHYILYSLTCREFRSSGLRFDPEGRKKMTLMINLDAFIESIKDKNEEETFETAILEHIAFGLKRESLIADSFWYGRLPKMARFLYWRWSPIFIWQPTVFGAELYVAAHGLRVTSVDELLSASIELPLIEGIILPEEAQKTKLFSGLFKHRLRRKT